jgi:hypothetical protein
MVGRALVILAVASFACRAVASVVLFLKGEEEFQAIHQDLE